MIANEQTSVSRVADREQLLLLLEKARGSLPGGTSTVWKSVQFFPAKNLCERWMPWSNRSPENPSDPSFVLDQLQEIGSPAVVTQTGGRYFGFVNGGILPVGLAATWMADVWDQNTAHYVMSPLNSRLEEICEHWIVSLLGFPEETAAGFVSGTTIANFSGLCAGRNELLRRRGWDVARKGLYGAPKIRVVAGADDALTKATLQNIQSSGECWCGGSTWNGRAVIRISVCDWATTAKEIERSVQAFVKARAIASR
jgi:hypothetical protein